VGGVHFSPGGREVEAAAVVSEDRPSRRAQVRFSGPLPEGPPGTQVAGG